MDFTLIGRESIWGRLENVLSVGSVLLEGGRGVGKTTVLERAAKRGLAGAPVLYFDVQGVTDARSLARRMAASPALARSGIEEAMARLIGSHWDAGEPWDGLHRLLAQRARDTVVVFDEIQVYLDAHARRDRGGALRELERLDALRRSDAARFVLAGSIGLRPIAAQLGITLSPDWHTVVLEPLAMEDARSLFEHHVPDACASDAAAWGAALCGGHPRWIERLARSVRGPSTAMRTRADVDAAVQRLLGTSPFTLDLGHLDRHPQRDRLRHALELAAEDGASRASVITGLAAKGVSRRDAEDALQVLQDDFLLDADARFCVPLLGLALRRRR